MSGVVAGENHKTHTGIPVLHAGSHFRHGLLQLMIHTIDPLHDGKKISFFTFDVLELTFQMISFNLKIFSSTQKSQLCFLKIYWKFRKLSAIETLINQEISRKKSLDINLVGYKVQELIIFMTSWMQSLEMYALNSNLYHFTESNVTRW